ncbi:MAG TPA: Nif11-like leader peptide family natural product precursor [Candidatus Obscuribacterales bacterium]
MSQENALDFLKQASDRADLSSQIKEADRKADIVNLAKQHGFEFSEDDMKNAIPAIQEKAGFFGELAKAVLALFAPAHDDYPTTGVQPFTGELSKKH